MKCNCDYCSLQERYAEALKERDEWRRRYEMAEEVIEKFSLLVNVENHEEPQ
jgi:hypothetical protein